MNYFAGGCVDNCYQISLRHEIVPDLREAEIIC